MARLLAIGVWAAVMAGACGDSGAAARAPLTDGRNTRDASAPDPKEGGEDPPDDNNNMPLEKLAPNDVYLVGYLQDWIPSWPAVTSYERKGIWAGLPVVGLEATQDVGVQGRRRGQVGIIGILSDGRPVYYGGSTADRKLLAAEPNPWSLTEGVADDVGENDVVVAECPRGNVLDTPSLVPGTSEVIYRCVGGLKPGATFGNCSRSNDCEWYRGAAPLAGFGGHLVWAAGLDGALLVDTVDTTSATGTLGVFAITTAGVDELITLPKAMPTPNASRAIKGGFWISSCATDAPDVWEVKTDGSLSKLGSYPTIPKGLSTDTCRITSGGDVVVMAHRSGADSLWLLEKGESEPALLQEELTGATMEVAAPYVKIGPYSTLLTGP